MIYPSKNPVEWLIAVAALIFGFIIALIIISKKVSSKCPRRSLNASFARPVCFSKDIFFPFTYEILRDFSEKWEFIGRNTPKMVVENLDYIRKRLNQECILAIMLGGELYYEKNTFEAYKDRHIVHREMNAAIRDWAKGTRNVRLMDVNKYLTDQSCFYDHFNHYIKPVYYKLAEEMVQIVNECIGSHLKETSKGKMLQVRLKEALAQAFYNLRKMIRR